ncbi:MAG: hypothetical protein ACOYD1_04565 [Candidatus Nanopelagicales bacterium]
MVADGQIDGLLKTDANVLGLLRGVVIGSGPAVGTGCSSTAERVVLVEHPAMLKVATNVTDAANTIRRSN